MSLSPTPCYVRPQLDTLAALPRDDLPPTQYAILDDPATTTTPRHQPIISHSQLRQDVQALAANLIIPITQPGSVVAILLPNTPHFVVAFLAVAHAGCVAAPLNPRYTAEELTFYLADAEATVLLVHPSTTPDAPVHVAARQVASTTTTKVQVVPLPEHISPATPPLLPPNDPHINNNNNNNNSVTNHTPGSGGDPHHDRNNKLRSLADRAPKPTDVALFLHTSGTTSRPKGVPLTHANLCASIANIADTYQLTRADANVLVMPLFHVHGLMSALLTTLATGGTVAIPPGGKFSASAFWPAILASNATWYTAVPTMHQILLARADQDYPKHNPPNLRFIRSCSASLAPSVLQRLESTFRAPVLEAYAMTEASHQMTSNPLPHIGPSKPGSVGIPQNVDVAILDSSNVVLPPNCVGEVCIRGANVTKGYHNNPEANKDAFAGGWFHTGDQGVLDNDGYLRLTGRIKELVNRGGEKISPLEVDAAILSHPGVTEAVSFAVPDEKYGEEVNAAVILKTDFVGKVSATDLTSFCKERLADFKIPKRFFIASDLPRTATGKIQRRIVAKHFLDLLQTAGNPSA